MNATARNKSRLKFKNEKKIDVAKTFVGPIFVKRLYEHFIGKRTDTLLCICKYSTNA